MNNFYPDHQTFEQVAEIYNEVRPGYPEIVYRIIGKNTEFSQESTILEVGCGQGIATEEIARNWNPYIMAIEPGANLRQIAMKRLQGNPKMTIADARFEEYHAEGKQYDGIFSATAFHWIEKTVKYKKAHDLLKDDGALVLYWNNFGMSDANMEEAFDELYVKYGFEKKTKTRKEILDEKIHQRKREIEESGLFHIIEHQRITHCLEYSSDQYINLLKTFPDHSQRKRPAIENMFQEIREQLQTNHGKIDIEITVNIEIARKT